jgi:hypothetical protein
MFKIRVNNQMRKPKNKESSKKTIQKKTKYNFIYYSKEGNRVFLI